MDPLAALGMDALYAVALVSAKVRHTRAATEAATRAAARPDRSDDDGTWQDMGGGKRKYRIRSMDTLVGLMQSRGGVL